MTDKSQGITPLMEQYLTIKRKHKDAVLFFRMGDFYEMFYEDAKIGSQVLGITLTSRAHGKAADVPLAGFPHHALEVYLAKMIKSGHRVAICEQTEDPKLAKTIVKREVLEIVTPGTALSDDLLETKRNNYLVSLFFDAKNCGVALVDVSTGSFELMQVPVVEVLEKVLSIMPTEILVSESHYELVLQHFASFRTITLTKRDDWTFHLDYAHENMIDHFGTLSLKGFGVDDLPLGICAAGAILAYLRENQKEKLVHINQLSRFRETDFMVIDTTTRRNLELIQPMNDSGRRSTLLAILDRTKTPMGGRLFLKWLLYPLQKVSAIQTRLDAVQELVDTAEMRKTIGVVLAKAGDLERLLAKFAAGRANARDAIALSATLKVTQQCKELLSNCQRTLLQQIHHNLDPLLTLQQEIDRAIAENPPLAITDGRIIRRGYNEELDKLRDIAFSGKDWIARLQKHERDNTGISSLKVSFNKVFGYYIEVTKPNLSKVPSYYIRKQTLVNAERYITQELKEYEEQILGAEEKMATMEYALFESLRKQILTFTKELQSNASHLAILDCLFSLAQVAVDHDYNRPDINESDCIEIKDGRHPVIEKLLPPGEPFVANDAFLDTKTEQLLIVTGPNMAGKSTYLRQIGLLVIMAQIGSFLPARSASIGIVDRVFTRVGASDNLAAGESTFLTEMNETANILNNATTKSLIILDEIGRGTSTFDGLSIAWAVAEYIHNTSRIAAKTIFATHYHELTELELVLSRVRNYNVAVKEWGDRIVFLRKIIRGSCDHSYGIHVAQLAGLPNQVISRAREVLLNLESEALNASDLPKLAQRRPPKPENQQMNLFAEMERSLHKELEKIDPNQLTPLEALNKLDQLKQLFSDK